MKSIMTFEANDNVVMNPDDDLVRKIMSSSRCDWHRDEIVERGVGRVIEVTPYKVHVLWSNGQELAHDVMRIKAAV